MKLCTKCETNYVEEGEDFCKSCRPQATITRKRGYAIKSYEPSTPIENDFVDYLEKLGYRLYTPSELQSTAFQYVSSVNKVRQREMLTWKELVANISKIIAKYDEGGEEELFGQKSHNTVINALKRFEEFLTNFNGKL